MYYEKDKIINNLSIGYLLKNKGIDFINGTNELKIKCIFHNEKTPSLSIFKDSKKFYCFGCKKSGSLIDLLMKYESKNFFEVLKDLNDNYYEIDNDNYDNFGNEKNKIYISKSKIKTEELKENQEELNTIMDYISNYWQKSIPPEIKKKYLLSKKLFSYQTYDGEKEMNGYGFNKNMIKKFRIGYSQNNIELFKLLIENFGEEIINKYLIDNKYFGIFDKTKKPIFKNMIIFPIILDGKVKSFTGRQTENTPKNLYNLAKYKIKSGAKNYLYNEDDLKEDLIIITEGATDCIKLKQYKFNSIALLTTNIKKDLEQSFFKKLKDKKVLIILDNDSNLSGNNGAEELNKSLIKNKINSSIILLPLEKGEEKIDINKFINSKGIKNFTKLVSPYIL